MKKKKTTHPLGSEYDQDSLELHFYQLAFEMATHSDDSDGRQKKKVIFGHTEIKQKAPDLQKKVSLEDKYLLT